MSEAYRGQNSTRQQQFAVAPFQKFDLNLANVDRSNGQYFAELEGDYLYIENTDAVFYITITSQFSNIKQSFIARNGVQIDTAFKGLTIQHANYTTVIPGQEIRAALIIGKGCSTFTNQSSTPITCGVTSLRIVSNNTTAFNLQLPLFSGQKFIRELYVTTPATSITSAFYSMSGTSGGIIQAPSFTSNDIGLNSVSTYSDPNRQVGSMDVISPFSNQFILRATNIPIAQQATFINCIVVGVGISFVNTVFTPASSVKLVVE